MRCSGVFELSHCASCHLGSAVRALLHAVYAMPSVVRSMAAGTCLLVRQRCWVPAFDAAANATYVWRCPQQKGAAFKNASAHGARSQEAASIANGVVRKAASDQHQSRQRKGLKRSRAPAVASDRTPNRPKHSTSDNQRHDAGAVIARKGKTRRVSRPSEQQQIRDSGVASTSALPNGHSERRRGGDVPPPSEQDRHKLDDQQSIDAGKVRSDGDRSKPERSVSRCVNSGGGKAGVGQQSRTSNWRGRAWQGGKSRGQVGTKKRLPFFAGKARPEEEAVATGEPVETEGMLVWKEAKRLEEARTHRALPSIQNDRPPAQPVPPASPTPPAPPEPPALAAHTVLKACSPPSPDRNDARIDRDRHLDPGEQPQRNGNAIAPRFSIEARPHDLQSCQRLTNVASQPHAITCKVTSVGPKSGRALSEKGRPHLFPTKDAANGRTSEPEASKSGTKTGLKIVLRRSPL